MTASNRCGHFSLYCVLLISDCAFQNLLMEWSELLCVWIWINWPKSLGWGCSFLHLHQTFFSLTQPFLIYKYHSWLALAEWPSFPFLLESQDLIFNSLSLLVYILWQITQENLVLNHDVILEHFNPWEWLVTNSSVSIIPKQTHWGYKDKGNDHQLTKLLIVKQILLVSTIKKV